MATEKPRFTITMDESLLGQVDDFKFSHRIKNQSKAIVALVEKGLEEYKLQSGLSISAIKKASESAGTETEAVQRSNIELFSEVLDHAGLLGNNQDLSDNDLEFLKAMFIAMKAHFDERQESRD
jgi:hypothetical protein